MNSMHWSEALGWAAGIGSMVTLVVGFGAGPIGWAAIVNGAASALFTFAGLTSTAYATYSRLSYSGTAAAYLHDANLKHAQIFNQGEWSTSNFVSRI